LKKPNREKKPIKIKKNQPVQFWFYKYEIEKIEPNPNRKKNEPNWKKIKPNRVKLKKLSQTNLNRFMSLKNKPNQNRSI
jgi:hypothetical protein